MRLPMLMRRDGRNWAGDHLPPGERWRHPDRPIGRVVGNVLLLTCECRHAGIARVAIQPNIALVNAQANPDALLAGYLAIQFGHAALVLNSTAHRIHHAGELGQHPVPGLFTIRPRCSVILGSTKVRR